MAKYTTELDRLLKSGFDLEMTAYPIFDEEYRGALNSKIIDHFRFREIGFETPGMFRHYINTTLNEIMPYYNQLYTSALLPLEPLRTKDITKTATRERTGEQTQEGTSKIESEGSGAGSQSADLLSVESDTPQNLLTVADIRGNLYASKANRQDNTISDTSSNTAKTDGTNSGTGTTHNLDTYTEHVFGHEGVQNQSKMLLEFRKTFINIDMMIIAELNSCFMGVF